jgi:hypothetical protein
MSPDLRMINPMGFVIWLGLLERSLMQMQMNEQVLWRTDAVPAYQVTFCLVPEVQTVSALGVRILGAHTSRAASSTGAELTATAAAKREETMVMNFMVAGKTTRTKQSGK